MRGQRSGLRRRLGSTLTIGPPTLTSAMAWVGVLAGVWLATPIAHGAAGDGRSYELVSPADKNGADISRAAGMVHASVSGSSVALNSNGAFDPAAGTGAIGVTTYRARRGPSAWSLDSVTPRQVPFSGASVTGSQVFAFDAELSRSILAAYDPPLVPEAPPHVVNLYRETVGQPYDLLSPSATPLQPDIFGGPALADATPDLEHIIFESTKNLTGDAVGFGPFLYEWRAGSLRLAGILPASEGGGPAQGSYAGQGASFAHYTETTISDDGRRVFFTDASTGRLYMRVDGASTVWLSRSEATVPDAVSQPVEFMGASADGSRVFFRSSERLVDSDPTSANDLYMYDVDATGRHLTLISADDEPADDGLDTARAIGVLGVSEDGSRVYFAGENAIVRGQDPVDANRLGLYLWQSGQTRYITGLATADPAGGDGQNWDVGGSSYSLTPKTSRASKSGRYLLFATSARQANGYDNAGNRQMYVYDADRDELACASCNPSGAPATGGAQVTRIQTPQLPSPYLSRALLDDGTAYFDTPDPLVPGDVNGRRDVYEWRAGHARLISTGRSDADSFFGDASASGNDVFLLTRERLVGWDRDANLDVYDARVGGGLPEPPQTREACSGDDCQPPATPPPSFEASATSRSSGAGDVRARAAPGFVVRRASRAARRAFARTGRLVLSVRTSTRGTVRTEAFARIRGLHVRVARAQATARAATTVKLRLRLNRGARQELRRRGALNVAVQVRMSGSPQVERLTFKLEARGARRTGRARVPRR